MKYETLLKLVRTERNRVVNAQDYIKDSVPTAQKWGKTRGEEIVMKALYKHVIDNGQIEIDGYTIGVTSSGSLKSTNGPAFRALVEKLRRQGADHLLAQVTKKWKTVRERAGMFKPETASESDKFTAQRFEGFD